MSGDGNCGQCGVRTNVCLECHNCSQHCHCSAHGAQFDSDELGLDPETDNTPETPERHA